MVDINFEDWEQRKLKEVADFIRGSFPQPYTNPEWYDELNGKPFVQVADIGFNLKLNDNTKLHISKIAEPKSRFVAKGTVVVALQGSIEKSIGRVAITQYSAFFDRTILIFESYKVPIDKKYFAQLIQNLFKIEKERAWGATISTITKEAVSSFVIGIPVIDEQEQTGLFFSELDKTIALHQDKLEKLKQLKQDYLQVMFPQKGEKVPRLRFAHFSLDWQQLKLGEIVNRITRKNKNLESTLPLTISAQEGLIDQNDFFNKQVASRDVSGYYLLKNGDFAYNKSYSNGYPWGAVKRLDKYHMGVLSTLYIVFTPTEVNSDFLVSYYDTTGWHKEVSKHAAEGARNHGLLNIAASDFFKTELFIPSTNKEQEKIGIFFRKLDDSINLQNDKIEKLKKIKNIYLKKMFI